MKSVIKGTYKAIVGAGAKTSWKSEQEQKHKVSAPKHCKYEGDTILDYAKNFFRHLSLISNVG